MHACTITLGTSPTKPVDQSCGELFLRVPNLRDPMPFQCGMRYCCVKLHKEMQAHPTPETRMALMWNQENLAVLSSLRMRPLVEVSAIADSFLEAL